MSYQDEYFDDELPEMEFLKSDQELKREINSLKRQIKKEEEWHNKEIEALREQIRSLLTKNMELSETCNLFAKGLDNFKKDITVITQIHFWSRKGSRGLKERLEDFKDSGKRIASVTPLFIDARGYTIEALIITEHYSKFESAKSAANKLFKE